MDASPPYCCPVCKKSRPGPAPDRSVDDLFPFCSIRCKQIDLGRWLDGDYVIGTDTEVSDGANESRG